MGPICKSCVQFKEWAIDDLQQAIILRGFAIPSKENIYYEICLAHYSGYEGKRCHKLLSKMTSLKYY